MSFTVSGRLRDSVRLHGRYRLASVTWHPIAKRRRSPLTDTRGLDGDMEVIVRVLMLEERGASVNATATGPAIAVDLDDGRATLLAIGSLLEPGYTVSGDLPPRVTYPLEPGDEA